MYLVQSIEPSFFWLVKYEFSKSVNGLVDKSEGKRLCYSRDDFLLLCLIIQDWNFLPFLVFKLGPDERVTSADSGNPGYTVGNNTNDSGSSQQHCSIWDFLVSLQRISPIFRHHVISHQHISSRDPKVTEDDIAIILDIERVLRSHISYLYTL